MDKVIELKDVNVRYGDLLVLEKATFNVMKGDVVGVVGPNGGGKTTLINAILGNVPLDSGSVRLFGQDISGFKDFQRVGYVAQNAIQFDPIFPATVWEIVALGCLSRARLGRRLTPQNKKDVRWALEMVELDDLRDRKISKLSGGQKQRIFLAKALVKRPELLILDEATAGLDICIQDRFISIVNTMRKEQELTVVTVSHDLSGVLCQANRLAVVNRKLYFQDITDSTDPTKALRQAYGEHFTFLFHHDHNTCDVRPIEIKEAEP
jgi:zinc transport system ATP-binding protein